MKVSHVSIVKASSAQESIVALINETFNGSTVESFLGCLSIKGLIGTCVDVEDRGYAVTTTSNYFIVTELSSTMFRVEHCSECEWTYGSNE